MNQLIFSKFAHGQTRKKCNFFKQLLDPLYDKLHLSVKLKSAIAHHVVFVQLGLASVDVNTTSKWPNNIVILKFSSTT